MRWVGFSAREELFASVTCVVSITKFNEACFLFVCGSWDFQKLFDKGLSISLFSSYLCIGGFNKL